MTSTSFNIGLTGAEKNSSRVLRPPGGGHSDIFGVKDNQNDIVTPSKRRNQPQSTIGSCFTMAEEPKENEVILNGDQIVKEEKNEVDNGIDENTAPGEEVEEKQPLKKEEEIIPAPRRGRVPPGGYSSGLW